MHGIIFASLYDYARATVGGDATSAVFDRGFYSMNHAHPDAELTALVEKLAAKRGVEVDALLRDFGAFTAEQTFARLYPAFFEIAGDTRSFLLTVEDRIHELVRSTIPHARPPALTVRPLGLDGVAIDYTSPRRLCRLLEGLVAGTAARFAQTAAVEEVECMRNGAPACRFEVRVAGE